MQQVQSPSVENLPSNVYYVNKEKRREEDSKNESHIGKQGIFSGAKAYLHQLTNDVFTYFPKGLSGSKNSDFYEYMAMGKFANLMGSITLISLYTLANHKFNAKDGASAKSTAKCFGAGVALYALGKWANQKIARAAIKASTGVPLNMTYINKVNELPEPGQEKGIVREQYPKVFDSVDFYRKDLLAKDGELNHNDMLYHDNKVAQKAGYGEHANATNQIASPKIRELKARTTALENITNYIVAATGVALGNQKAFDGIKLGKGQGIVKNTKTTLHSISDSAINAFKQLWKGSDKNALTKNYGKALLILSALSPVVTWLIPTLGFKKNPDTLKSKVDTNREYEVC